MTKVMSKSTKPKKNTLETPTSPIKAIRARCLDCCCGSAGEVRICDIRTCPLHPFRSGKNPYRTKRVMTEEQKQKAVERLAKARKKMENEDE